MMSELDKHERQKQAGKGTTSGFMSEEEAMEKVKEYEQEGEDRFETSD